MAVNKVILLGFVGNQPEIKQMTNGEVASFSLATSESWKDKNSGERKDKTEWHKVVIYNPALINLVKNYVNKGSQLYLEGSLATRKWTDNKGVEKYTTEIVLQRFGGAIQLISSKSNFEQENKTNEINEDDEIPF